MAKVFIEEATLTAIGDAIRGKEGTTELVPVNDMATRISAIQGGGSADEPSAEELTHTGNMSYRFSNNGWNWALDRYGKKMTTKDLTNISRAFYNSGGIKAIPFDLNIKSATACDSAYIFGYCTNITEIPDIYYPTNCSYFSMDNVFDSCQKLIELPYLYNAYPSGMAGFFSGCYSLRTIPEDYFDTWNTARVSYSYFSLAGVFNMCYSLRKIPSSFFEKIAALQAPSSTSYVYYNNLARICYVLDEVVDIPVIEKTFTSNAFSGAFYNDYRLKAVTFKTNDDGTPKTAPWKSQTVDLSYAGFSPSGHGNFMTTSYNSGISVDKEAKDDATYQAVKNDPDWFSQSIEYSRYNLESAIETLNSLPDTSATGTNIIKFKRNAGSKTDGGGITDEGIAAAAASASARGWTVSFVN